MDSITLAAATTFPKLYPPLPDKGEEPLELNKGSALQRVRRKNTLADAS